MGALHAGHLSLIEAAREDCDLVVATIFVNPTQFGENEDLSRYPRPLADDLELCQSTGVDILFNPDASTVYPEPNASFVDVPGLSDILEGAQRPGHFRGVATIVLKLLNIVMPDVAYFGQKDFQQQLLIRRMVEDLNVPVQIQTCPTIREKDGLALSSRNTYLTGDERQTALELSATLRMAGELIAAGNSPEAIRRQMKTHLESISGLVLDYATIAEPDTLIQSNEPRSSWVALVAARVGKTRLIDNMRFET